MDKFIEIDENNFFNASKIAKYQNKQTKYFLRLKKTKKEIKKLEEEKKLKKNQLIIKKGKNYWFHYFLAVHLCEWVDQKLLKYIKLNEKTIKEKIKDFWNFCIENKINYYEEFKSEKASFTVKTAKVPQITTHFTWVNFIFDTELLEFWMKFQFYDSKVGIEEIRKYLPELLPPEAKYYLNEEPNDEILRLFNLTNRQSYSSKIKVFGKIITFGDIKTMENNDISIVILQCKKHLKLHQNHLLSPITNLSNF